MLQSTSCDCDPSKRAAAMRRSKAAVLFLLLPILTHLPVTQSATVQISTYNIYWNSSTFQRYSTTNRYTIQANMNDQVVFNCPYSTTNGEYYIIYYTTQQSVVSTCDLTADPDAVPLVQCTNQQTAVPSAFTLVPTNPFYGQLAFEPNNVYYFISTSTMQSSGIGNKVGGACSSIGAVVSLRISCCPDDYVEANPSTSQTTSSPATCCQHSIPLSAALTSTGRRCNFEAQPLVLLLSLVLGVFLINKYSAST